MAPPVSCQCQCQCQWGDNKRHIPLTRRRASVVSVDSILSDTPGEVFGASEALRSADLRAKGATSSQPGEDRTFGSPCHGTDFPFIRHEKYFFKDGNVTFLVDGTLYCVHRYFFSRDSKYFSDRFSQLEIYDHEELPTIISLMDMDVSCGDFDAFLSVIYPESFVKHQLSYEEWKSVLHLSTLWGFASIRTLALASIDPPTSHDQLLLARSYSVDHWVLPALTALCERVAPLSVEEARKMEIEDVVLVATVREDIRDSMLKVCVAETQRRVETALAGRFSSFEGVNAPLANSTSGPEREPSLAIGAPASLNHIGVMNERTIMAGPSVSSARAGDTIGDSRDKQLGEAPEEVEVGRNEQRQTVEEVSEKAGEMWWMETAARHKADTEAEHQVEAGAEVTNEETRCQTEAQEMCVEEPLHHTVATHEDCRICIYRSESGFWGKRLCYCITCRKYMYG